jgi:hypothetical protein
LLGNGSVNTFPWPLNTKKTTEDLLEAAFYSGSNLKLYKN